MHVTCVAAVAPQAYPLIARPNKCTGQEHAHSQRAHFAVAAFQRDSVSCKNFRFYFFQRFPKNRILRPPSGSGLDHHQCIENSLFFRIRDVVMKLTPVCLNAKFVSVFLSSMTFMGI